MVMNTNGTGEDRALAGEREVGERRDLQDREREQDADRQQRNRSHLHER
jgi:hypothetical protein